MRGGTAVQSDMMLRDLVVSRTKGLLHIGRVSFGDLKRKEIETGGS